MLTKGQDKAAGDGALDDDGEAERGQCAQPEPVAHKTIRRHVNEPVETEKRDHGDKNNDRRRKGQQAHDEISHDRVGEEIEEDVVEGRGRPSPAVGPRGGQEREDEYPAAQPE